MHIDLQLRPPLENPFKDMEKDKQLHVVGQMHAELPQALKLSAAKLVTIIQKQRSEMGLSTSGDYEGAVIDAYIAHIAGVYMAYRLGDEMPLLIKGGDDTMKIKSSERKVELLTERVEHLELIYGEHSVKHMVHVAMNAVENVIENNIGALARPKGHAAQRTRPNPLDEIMSPARMPDGGWSMN